jgi:hypothetical protein
MRVFAYCAASFEHSIKKAAGVLPHLSPPVTLASFQPQWLEGYDLLYFKLHGLPEQPFWYGDNWITALDAEQIRKANLSNAVVFVANCHLYQDTLNFRYFTTRDGKHPMLTALLDAGAQAVIGGAGSNYAKPKTIHGADLLGLALRRLLSLGFSPFPSFRLARLSLRFKPKNAATKDTLNFRYFTRRIP